jgi:hypothetical protein
VRVAEGVDVAGRRAGARRRFEQVDPLEGRHVPGGAGEQAGVAGAPHEGDRPLIVVEADPHEEVGLAERRDVPRLRLEAVRVLGAGEQALDGDPVPPDRLHERTEVGRRRHHSQGGGRRPAPGPGEEGRAGEQRRGEPPSRRCPDHEAFAKSDLGTRQSAAIEVSE